MKIMKKMYKIVYFFKKIAKLQKFLATKNFTRQIYVKSSHFFHKNPTFGVESQK